MPNLLDLAEECREVFRREKDMQNGLDKARDLLVRRTMLARRRTM